MYKKIPFAVLLLAYIISCNNNSVPLAHCIFNQNPHVKGNVKSVIDSTTYFPGGDTLSNEKLFNFTETVFNNNGAYAGGGRNETAFYDADDIDSLFDITGKFSSEQLISKNNRNNLKLNKTNYSHHSLYTVEEDYVTSATGAVYLKYKYQYDDSCNILQFEEMNEDLTMEKKFTFQYDDKNNLIGCKMFSGTDQLLKEVKYEYDKNNNEIGYTIYDKIKKQDYDFSFTYQDYDTIGNWRKRIKYKNNKPVAITMRHIKYF